MKKLLFIILFAQLVYSQDGSKERSKEERDPALDKTTAVEDRAGGTHNASNIGLFFENRGKLYPRRLTQGPSGEFPIGSAKHYIYRINPMVGVPGNVIQGRYTTNEEWEAVGGYHNKEYAKIAFSDNPKTWHPTLGWPVKDAKGNPIILSDQDSYCIYDDSKNTIKPLGIVIAQTGYTYGVKFAENIIFYKFEIMNQGSEDQDSLYFSMYCDIDVGDVSGGTPEYEDDRLDYDKENNFVYFFDDGISTEWSGGVTGYFGIAFLKTPFIDSVQAGITDMHYNLYNDDKDEDELQYAILSSNPDLVQPQSLIDRYFHIGSGSDIHYDDPATIPVSGLDILGTVSSGPYTVARGDTFVFYTALITGNNKVDLYRSLDVAQKVLQFNFEISKPPTTPTLSAFAGDGYVTLFWDDVAELSIDKFSSEYDFEGYRIYKSVDKGLHWDQMDRNVDPSVGSDPIPMIEFDLINLSGADAGIQYSYTDSTVTNGFEYWYTITAYDRESDLVESLESPRGNSADAVNTVSVIPRTKALDRIPVTSQDVEHIGKGISNYVIDVKPVDQDSLGDREYQVKFTYLQRTEKGKLKTRVIPVISDSSKTESRHVGIEFFSPTSFHLIDLETGEDIGAESRNYRSGTLYSINRGLRIKIEDPDLTAPAEFLPQAGNYITLYFATYAVRNGVDTVITPVPFSFERPFATSDGVIYTLHPPEIIHSVSRVAGTDQFDINFSVVDETLIKTGTYFISVQRRGFDAEENGFVDLMLVSTTGDTSVIDSLFNLGTFEFDGIRGRITFLDSSPPSPGNAFVVETVIPIRPNIQDAYRFKIEGSKKRQLLAKSDLDSIRVVPNPYIVSSLYEPEFGELRKEPLRQLQFINLPQECTIYIFTIAGDLVKTIRHDQPIGTVYWDLRSDGGREITSGIYLYVVKTDDSQYMNRFAIIK